MVQADTRIVDVIRQMQEQRKQDRQIFYDIYSQQEKRQDPEKKDTGLFFFRGEKKAPFAVVCAGGGFYYVGSIHESLPHALELSRQGYNGFALVYRTRTADAACQDLASYGLGAFGEGRLPRACAVIMQYTGHGQYSPADPATYACVGGRDSIADWRVMKRRLQCMEELGIDTEFHLYPGLRHGFGLGVGTEAEGWIDDAVRFWDRNRAGKKALR